MYYQDVYVIFDDKYMDIADKDSDFFYSPIYSKYIFTFKKNYVMINNGTYFYALK